MALQEPSWVDAMDEELNQFDKLNVWKLVELPKGKKSLDMRWVFRNKQDDTRVIVRNKSRLVVRGFRQRGTIDQTLFLKTVGKDLILVQIYVDDIIFGSTSTTLCTEFEGVMKRRFEMSSLGEMTTFLGLQVRQSATGFYCINGNMSKTF
ncbi:uncharacterized protein LOC143623906 [Bidens hawaiensis]|uniref:uncharacterized protein LOC143623906 n=1 Tax=Bidens hawaiensis TaxID=980011 RepID=UPI0040490211